jgi:endonuclease/exonuclease/phosphatase (EEP) superfamily protein YafD
VPGYSFYPGPGVQQRNKQNIVAWKSSRFSLVTGRSLLIPYKRGSLVPMPVVKLRDKQSGQQFWVVTVHNAPGKSKKARTSRARALSKQIALTRQLVAAGDPVFMTGDMNDRVGYFCRFTASGQMRAAAGGSNAGSCSPPKARIAQIDWIFGSKRNVAFSGYGFVRSPLVRRTSDHPLIVARARMTA